VTQDHPYPLILPALIFLSKYHECGRELTAAVAPTACRFGLEAASAAIISGGFSHIDSSVSWL